MNLLNFASKKGGICFYRNSHSAVNTSVYIQTLLSVVQQPNLGQSNLILRFLDHTQTETNKQTNIHTHTHKQTHTHPVRVGVDAATYTTHNKHNDETSISSVEFEPAIPAIKRPQTYSLEDTATAICPCKYSDHFSNNLTILLRERGAFPTTFISKNFITHMHKKLSFYICMLYFDTFFRK